MKRRLPHFLAAFALTALFAAPLALAADFYVAMPANGGDDSNPGTSAEPFATIGAAITAADGSAATIHVAAGTYQETELTLEAPITIEGDPSDRTAVKIGKKVSSGQSIFILSAAGATLRNLTVQNGYAYKQHGGNIRMTADGVVSNCVVTSGSCSNQGGKGGNIYLSAGLVVDSLITASAGGGGTSEGTQVYMTGGRVMRCMISDGTNPVASARNSVGAVMLVGGGILENSLVRGNDCGQCTVVRLSGAAIMVNCTIVGNSSQYGAVFVADASPVVANCLMFGNGGTAATEWGNGQGARFSNCASSVANANGVDWVTLPSASWVDYFLDNAEYAPAGPTPLRDAGSNALFANYAVSATDYAGNARFSPANGAVDIGCHELDQSGVLTCYGVVSSKASILSGSTVDFTAISAGAAGTVTYEWDFGDGSEHLVTTATSVTRRFDATGLFTIRVRAKDGSGEYCGWLSVVQTVRVSDTDLYVSAANGSDANAGTAAAPFKTVGRALGSLTNLLSPDATDIDGVTIHVSAGTYAESGFPALATRVIVEGDASDRTAVKIGKSVMGQTVFILSAAGATLRNLTVQSGRATTQHGGNIRMTADGVVSNCVVTSGSCNNQGGKGGNIHVAAGLVVDSLITASAGGGGTSEGAQLYITGGRVLRCRISDGTNPVASARNSVGAVMLVGGGILENCLVTGNNCGQCTVVRLSGAAKMVNCTIAGNTCQYGAIFVDDASPVVANCLMFGNGGTAATEWGNNQGARFSNCASTVVNADGADWVTLESTAWTTYFTDNVDYAPNGPTPLHDAGLNAPYADYAVSATDLAGNIRISPANGAIDIGCYELVISGVGVSGTVASKVSILKGATVDFNANAAGAAGTVTFEWDFGDGSAHLFTTATSVTRRFDAAGLFAVKLRAKDGDGEYGDWSSVALPVRVSEPDLYVATTGDDANDGTAAAPFKTVTRALNSLTNLNSQCATDVDGVTVHIAAGTYAECGLPALGSRVVVEGDASDRTAAKVGKAVVGQTVFILSAAGATLRNLTVQNGYRNAQNGGNIRMEADGVVSNCVITSGRGNNGGGYGNNIHMTAGLVVDSLITAGWHDGAGTGKTTQLYMTGGRVARCRITDGSNPVLSSGNTMGAVMLVDGGILENCLVSGNNCSQCTVVRLSGAAKMVNCTLIGNTSQYGAVFVADASPIVANSLMFGNGNTAATEWGNAQGTRFSNCASSVTISDGADCIGDLTAAAFTDYANADYHPAKDGVLVNAGTRWDAYLGYGATSEKDLAGAARLCGKFLDIGCYEAYLAPSGFKMIVR